MRVRRSATPLCKALITLGLVSLVSLVSGSNTTSANAASLRSSLEGVNATLTYHGTYPLARSATLTIWRARHVVYSRAVTSPLCGSLCWPTAADGSNSQSAVQVVRLGSGAPDVVLGLYSGGAHCCYIDQVFAPASRSKYRMSEMSFGDPGAHLEVLPGSPYAKFVTADDAFAYTFTDFAASGLPIKIMNFTRRGFSDVTRQYPVLIRADAATWLAAFRDQVTSHYSDSVGVIAAWAADEYQLGLERSADAFLRAQAVAGHLNSPLYPTVKGLVFVRFLQKFLHQRGY